MKDNQSITQKEYVVRPDCAIISYTDASGNITYVNDEFIEYAGFSHAELIGKPHNIIRHPDMPPEAFRDMWATLKKGRAWQGIVKNRCANGDHYWVKATATPLSKGGYMSVRLKATDQEIQAAAALYARMQAGSRDRLCGGYHLTGILSRFSHFYQGINLTPTAMLPMLFFLVATLGMILGWHFNTHDPAAHQIMLPLVTGIATIGGISFV